MKNDIYRKWFRLNRRLDSRKRKLGAATTGLAEVTRRWLLRWLWRLS